LKWVRKGKIKGVIKEVVFIEVVRHSDKIKTNSKSVKKIR
jgi:hypothetical protein